MVYIFGSFLTLPISRLPHSNLTAVGGVITAVGEESVVPARMAIRAYPNPFEASTHIRLTITKSGKATVKIYDVQGRLVRHLLSDAMSAGERSLEWNGRNDQGKVVSSGLYFCRVETGSLHATAKVLRFRQ
jgi:flagellar hook assembly protein FlgD